MTAIINSQDREEQLTADELRALDFVRDCLGGQHGSGYLEVRVIGDDKPAPWFADLTDRHAVLDALERAWAHQSDHPDHGLYFGAAPRVRCPGSGSDGSATDQDVACCFALRVDLDSDRALDRLAELVPGTLPAPSYLVESGGLTAQQRAKLHAYLLLAQPLDANAARTEIARLAQALGGDSAIVNESRVMRLPGTLHAKRAKQDGTGGGTGLPVRVIAHPAHIYALEEIVGQLPPLSVPAAGATQSDVRGEDRIPEGKRRPELISAIGKLREAGHRSRRSGGRGARHRRVCL